MTATKTRPVETDPDPAPDVAAARERVTAALALVAALDAELPLLDLQAKDARRDIQRARHNVQPTAQAQAEARLATLKDRDRQIRLHEHPAALQEVGDARNAYEAARNPLLPVDVAVGRLRAAETTLAGLTVEREALPGRLRDAALDGDVETQVALGTRSEELPLAIAAAQQKVLKARRHHAESMAAAAEPGSHEARTWKERATMARQMQVEVAEAAAVAAAGRAAPIVRSRWQGSAA